MPYYKSTVDGKDRLIKAKTVAAARNHLVKPMVPEVTLLDTDGVADMMGAGIKVEDATASEAEPAAEPVKDGDK